MAINMGHTAAAGMVAIEQEPQQDANGVWRQMLVLEPAPWTKISK